MLLCKLQSILYHLIPRYCIAANAQAEGQQQGPKNFLRAGPYPPISTHSLLICDLLSDLPECTKIHECICWQSMWMLKFSDIQAVNPPVKSPSHYNSLRHKENVKDIQNAQMNKWLLSKAPGKTKLSLVATQQESCSICHGHCRDIHITDVQGRGLFRQSSLCSPKCQQREPQNEAGVRKCRDGLLLSILTVYC